MPKGFNIINNREPQAGDIRSTDLWHLGLGVQGLLSQGPGVREK